ncbi:hypothetical protein E3O42_15200 [Cryobacterium adonitolivorans]|uniref:Uncharacterized protein n=1 Tax=Cryobacterium adonitolivorans TaxID=1259189 RepID=A0A4R8W3R1_9MICO|nr:hypothetical protein [Cryobacterium adonitolivorans]TFB98710.1 hypothetical protein E3O42_15200 [Cryobacterium adonitolivorans]
MNVDTTKPWSTARLRERFITPELVSGTVLVSVVIAVADESGGILDVFAITLISVLVFWATEVFAHAVAAQRRRPDTETVQVRASVRLALHSSQGLLLAGIPPLIFLLFGLVGVRDGEVAYWTALWVEVAILAAVGWIAFGGFKVAWYWRVCGSLATAALGMLAMLLKILVH